MPSLGSDIFFTEFFYRVFLRVFLWSLRLSDAFASAPNVGCNVIVECQKQMLAAMRRLAIGRRCHFEEV